MEEFFTNKQESLILQDLGIKGKTLMAWSYAGSPDESEDSRYGYKEGLICIHNGQTSGTEWGSRANYGHGIIAPAFLMAQLYKGFDDRMARIFKKCHPISTPKVILEYVVFLICQELDTQEKIDEFNFRMNDTSRK